MKKNLLSILLITACVGTSLCACEKTTPAEEEPIITQNENGEEGELGQETPPTPPEPHVHSFDGDYVYDETYHWKVCAGKDCNETTIKELHVFEDNNICKYCGYDNGIGYIKKPVSFTKNQVAGTYTPDQGKINFLVVPINLIAPADALPNDQSLDTWTDRNIQTIEDIYFKDGLYENGFKTVKQYFKDASCGKIEIEGVISDIIDLEFEKEEFEDVLKNTYQPYLEEVVEKAVASIPNFDESKFDINNDGYFDAINFITNYHGAAWNDRFWPHMSTYFGAFENTLNIHSYDMSSIEHLYDSCTPIHEQSHCFGINDYYDYDGEVSYSGGFDMQVDNYCDWNAYSKMQTGWIEPTIINGEGKSTTVTLNSSQHPTDPDCLVIPADYSTYNGSAFDEYFVIELINDTNNNEYYYDTQFGLKNKGYGVRVAHVYAELFLMDLDNYYENMEYYGYGYGKQVDCAEDAEFYLNSVSNTKYAYCITNDCSKSPSGYAEKYDRCPEYAVIQNGFVNTFGKAGWRNRHNINETDLFYAGDSFTFNDAKEFLVKESYRARNKMANGETFEYTIKFDKVEHDSFTVTVTKN